MPGVGTKSVSTKPGWWYGFIIPALQVLRQEDYKHKASVHYIGKLEEKHKHFPGQEGKVFFSKKKLFICICV